MRRGQSETESFRPACGRMGTGADDKQAWAS